MAIPEYTCSPDDPVHGDIELLDANGALVAGPMICTECTAQWFCDAAPDFGMWGPNYPLTWRHTPPPPPPPEDQPVDDQQTPAP